LLLCLRRYIRSNKTGIITILSSGGDEMQLDSDFFLSPSGFFSTKEYCGN
jgi:hypothetical protein